MPVNVDLIRAYTDGLVAVQHKDLSTGALTSVTRPTTASDPLPEGYDEVGAVSGDGLTETTEQERTDIFIWQKNALARRIPGQFTKTWAFAGAETNLVTLGVQFPGSTITQTAEGASVAEKPPSSDIREWVLHGIDGDDREVRLCLPKAEVTERGEVVWSAEGITVYQWTLSAYPDDTGVVAYRYYVDEDMATGS